MGKHIDRDVFNMSHKLIIGWPSTFNMVGTSSYDTVMTQFYVNVPAEGFLRIHKFQSLRHDEIEFCELEFPFLTLARLPGAPVDPYLWTRRGNLHTRIAPMRLGAGDSGVKHDVKLRMEYTGLVPRGMRAGEPMRLVVMFMGVRD